MVLCNMSGTLRDLRATISVSRDSSKPRSHPPLKDKGCATLRHFARYDLSNQRSADSDCHPPMITQPMTIQMASVTNVCHHQVTDAEGD